MSPLSYEIYKETYNRVEKWTGLMDITLMKITPPAVLLPKFIISFYDYLYSNQGGDSFQLSLLLWCVHNLCYRKTIKT